MPSPPTFAERLRLALALRNLTPTDLARRIRRQPRTVGNWANGSTQPTAADIAACSAELDVSADYLVGRVDNTSGLTPGSWILDADLLAHARTHPRDRVLPGFRVPPRPIVVSDQEASRLLSEIQGERKKGRTDGKA
jgi:transcriptional regulator with XRE-family HTH domain